MRPDERYAYAQSFRVHVGVDTGKLFHVLVARPIGGRRTKPRKVHVNRDSFEAAVAFLQERFPDVEPSETLVGVEFAGHHGFTFANYLREQGYVVVSVLPAHTKKAKELEDNSPNKSDDIDARLICRLAGQGIFVPFPFLTDTFAQLKVLASQRHRLTVEQTRFKNRLQGILDLVWPEFAGHFSSIMKKTPLAILRRWPLPQDLAAGGPKAVHHLIRKTSRGQIKPDRIREIIATAGTSLGLTQTPEERRMEILHLFARWDLLRAQLEEVEARIEAMAADLPEVRALRTVPEVDTVCAVVIITELGDPHSYDHPRQVIKLAGMNMVGKSSGISVQGRRWQSKRGRPMLRRELFLLAGRWCHPDRGLFREERDRMLARNGNRKTKALCALARRLVPVLLHIMQTGEAFDRERFLADRFRNRAQQTA